MAPNGSINSIMSQSLPALLFQLFPFLLNHSKELEKCESVKVVPRKGWERLGEIEHEFMRDSMRARNQV